MNISEQKIREYFSVFGGIWTPPLTIVEAVIAIGFASSKREARQLIDSGAIKICPYLLQINYWARSDNPNYLIDYPTYIFRKPNRVKIIFAKKSIKNFRKLTN